MIKGALILGWMLLLIVDYVSAQTESRRLYIGMDLFKSLPVFFDQGYVLEPSLVYKAKSNFNVDFAVGFARIEKDILYSNMRYHNDGYYLKLGMGKLIPRTLKKYNEVTIQANLIYSDFTETGQINFEGGYYGDLEVEKVQPNRLVSIEAQPGYWLPLSNRFSLHFQVRFGFIIYESSEKHFPVYYVPGIGYVQKLGDRDTVPSSRRVTEGISVRAVYKFLRL